MPARHAPFLLAASAGTATLTAASAPSPLYPVYQRLFGFSAFTLTFVFAVYVFALLAALLTVGSLSDRVGRRPVASTALLLLALGMLLFAVADGVGGLVLARVVQGVAVGAATGTTTAMVLDTAPDPSRGALVSSAVPALGIAIGAVVAGALVQLAPDPRQLVFAVFGVLYLVLAGAVWLVPESADREGRPAGSLWRSLLPSAGMPRSVRPTFVAVLPSMTATWALGGLYLSLGSSVLATVIGERDHLVVGLALGSFFGAGVVGTVASTRLPAEVAAWWGYSTLAVGVLGTILATATGSLAVYVAGSVVAGYGFGATFRGVVAALGAASPAEHRGRVFATMYIVSYLAFSVPALVAGLAVGHYGLQPTAVVYGSTVVALVLVAVAAEVGQRRRRLA